jgi:hypothetical protein
MPNDSSTGGYLLPDGGPTAPLQGAALTAFFQQVFTGLTGLAGSMVRPRWQPVPPNQPDVNSDWMAFGITSRRGDTFAYEVHNPAAAGGNGQDLMFRNEELEILCSVYGPDADANASNIRDGLAVPQNREALVLAGMALVECGDIVAVPQLLNAQWFYRLDMPVRFRRSVVQTYSVLHLLSAAGTLYNDNGAPNRTINVNHP